MSNASADPLSEIAELRHEFDRAFATLPQQAAAHFEALLAIRIAGDAYAARAREVTGLSTRGRIVPVPGPVAELLGVTAIRGTLVPVYSLAALLGYPLAGDLPRWLMLCGVRDDPVALAFDQFEQYLHVPRTELYAAEAAEPRRRHVRNIVCVKATISSIIDIPSILDVIKQRVGSAAPTKEQ